MKPFSVAARLGSVNPATGETLCEFEPDTPEQVEHALVAAVAAQRAWRQRSVPQRLPVLSQLAAALRAQRERLARLITLEMGKPIAEALSEVDKCALTCEHYAAHAAAGLADDVTPSNATDSRVVYDPLGVVLAVMPWNYPLWQAIRAIAPALAAGNAVVLKHASNVPQCTLALNAVMHDAGVPAGLFRALLLPSAAVEDLIRDDRVSAITFTGSTPVGRRLAAAAGSALKKQVLELGGSDPFVVLADADVVAAARAAVKARFQNTGQSCIAAKRFIVHESVADAFADALTAHARALVVGDPLQSGTQIGPMARANLRDELHDQVQRTLAQGAVLRTGGRLCEGPGWFYEPTVLDHVSPDMVAAREETFGPVAAVVRVRDAEQALEVANGTEFGLGAAIWTQDAETGRSLSRRMDAGAVFINGVVASDPRLPFGGVRQSGYGRELGVQGLREFTNTKTVWTGPAH